MKNKVSLYSILFENQGSYFDAPFALAVSPEKTRFVLYSTVAVKEQGLKAGIAAYVKVKKEEANCGLAYQIATSVRGPNFPGAGLTLYKIVSSYLNSPITSDRHISSSARAKSAWRKISSDPDFEPVFLDNWLWNGDFETKTYVKDIDLDTGNFVASPKPRTSTPKDDCVLPGDSVDLDNLDNDVADRLANLGSPFAFQSHVSFENLIKNHENFVTQNELGDIFSAASQLFVSTMQS